MYMIEMRMLRWMHTHNKHNKLRMRLSKKGRSGLYDGQDERSETEMVQAFKKELCRLLNE